MKRILLLSCFVAFVLAVTAQHEADNWRFGVLTGIDFSSGSPVAVTGSLNTNEGCAVISDVSGNLLFYTDGITVWNNLDQVMPNGNGLMGGISSTQSALIIPKPGSSTQYYIFTVDEIGGPNGFRYSLVDMTLQGGLGDVTSTKNILVLNNVTEKLSAVHGETGSYWIAVHEWGTDAFYVYKLNSSGLQPPVISNIGIVHDLSQIQNTYGQLKFAPCGNKLALATGYLDTVQVFEFVSSSGLIKNAVTIPFTTHVYGIEFSHNGQYLYVTSYDPAATLLQYDLSSGNQATIIASQQIISSTPDIYALQLGPDNKIYAARSWSQFLGVINDPTLPGIACNYVDNGFDVDPNFMGTTSALGLPGFIQSIFKVETACLVSGIEETLSSPENMIYPNPFDNGFKMEITTNLPADIYITDETGKLIEQFTTSRNNFSYGESLDAGIYFITVLNQTENKQFKVIKTKSRE